MTCHIQHTHFCALCVPRGGAPAHVGVICHKSGFYCPSIEESDCGVFVVPCLGNGALVGQCKQYELSLSQPMRELCRLVGGCVYVDLVYTLSYGKENITH